MSCACLRFVSFGDFGSLLVSSFGYFCSCLRLLLGVEVAAPARKQSRERGRTQRSITDTYPADCQNTLSKPGTQASLAGPALSGGRFLFLFFFLFSFFFFTQKCVRFPCRARRCVATRCVRAMRALGGARKIWYCSELMNTDGVSSCLRMSVSVPVPVPVSVCICVRAHRSSRRSSWRRKPRSGGRRS